MSSVSHLQRILFAIAGGLIALDAGWGVLGGFRVDVAAYLPLMGIGLVRDGGGHFLSDAPARSEDRRHADGRQAFWCCSPARPTC